MECPGANQMEPETVDLMYDGEFARFAFVGPRGPHGSLGISQFANRQLYERLEFERKGSNPADVRFSPRPIRFQCGTSSWESVEWTQVFPDGHHRQRHANKSRFMDIEFLFHLEFWLRVLGEVGVVLSAVTIGRIAVEDSIVAVKRRRPRLT